MFSSRSDVYKSTHINCDIPQIAMEARHQQGSNMQYATDIVLIMFHIYIYFLHVVSQSNSLQTSYSLKFCHFAFIEKLLKWPATQYRPSIFLTSTWVVLANLISTCLHKAFFLLRLFHLLHVLQINPMLRLMSEIPNHLISLSFRKPC